MSTFDGKDIATLGETLNQTNSEISDLEETVEGKADTSDLNNYATIEALDEVTDDLNGFRFGVDSDGNYGYYKDGADTVTPFKSGAVIDMGTGTSFNVAKYYDNYAKLTADNFICVPVGGSVSAGSRNYAYSGGMGITLGIDSVKSYDATTGVLTAYFRPYGYYPYDGSGKLSAASANMACRAYLVT